MQDSKRFYDEIPAFKDFRQVANPKHYRPVPPDWNVVITDVRGSTKAIAENRYKDVNMLGASTIVAALNSLKGRKVPFVFGGDGATLLVHDDDIGPVSKALRSTQVMARSRFGLELRVGVVPVRELNIAGSEVHVSRYQVSPISALAMIRGGGLTVAERWIKSESRGARFRLEEAEDPDTSFEGLSCRWNPVPAKRGTMISLLVMALAPDQEEAAATYSQVLGAIETILRDEGNGDSRPIDVEKLDSRFTPSNFRSEIRIKTRGKGFGASLKIVFWVWIQALLTFVAYNRKLTFSFFDPKKYVGDLVANTDFRKFDDMLRMIRDCDERQRMGIEAYLSKLRAENRIAYGIHASAHALMTCMVFDSQTDHIHFVDGSDGGYAMAAKQLKEQIASAATAANSGNTQSA